MLLHTDGLPIFYTSIIVCLCTTTMNYLMNDANPDAATSITVPDATPSPTPIADLCATLENPILDNTHSGIKLGSIEAVPSTNKKVEP